MLVQEIAHVMLKPDALEYGMRETIISELLEGECEIVAHRRLVLDLHQIAEIYSHFSNERARPVVFSYFTTRETEHLALIGPSGLHDRLDVIKGQTGSGIGIRGKYYTRYTRLSEAGLAEWLAGTLSNAEDIDLEMFGRDILHVSDTQSDSVRGLKSILYQFQIDDIRRRGIDI